MPYIDKEKRVTQTCYLPEDAGELNFAITNICSHYLARKGLRYANINEVIGALECAKLELYRRIAVPYEDTKIAQNGDVYPDKILTRP
jgi:hypothetical protein